MWNESDAENYAANVVDYENVVLVSVVVRTRVSPSDDRSSLDSVSFLPWGIYNKVCSSPRASLYSLGALQTTNTKNSGCNFLTYPFPLVNVCGWSEKKWTTQT